MVAGGTGSTPRSQLRSARRHGRRDGECYGCGCELAVAQCCRPWSGGAASLQGSLSIADGSSWDN